MICGRLQSWTSDSVTLSGGGVKDWMLETAGTTVPQTGIRTIDLAREGIDAQGRTG
jgi:hypothetical protein